MNGETAKPRMLMAYTRGFTKPMYDELRALGLELVFIGGEDRVGSDELHSEQDFSGIDAAFCFRLFLYNDIARFPRLRFIQTTSHGIDHLPLDYIRAHGIRLCDARGVYGVPMAEYALGAVLQFYKQTPLYARQQRAHLWVQHESIRELGGRQVTLLGAGSVATECARRFAAMGCRCVGLCRHPSDAWDGFAFQRSIDELDAVLPETDILLLALPLTDATRGIIDARRLSLLKEGAVLVNIARGPVVDAEALMQALQSGRLSGAAVDVFDEEPLPASSPLWDAPNLILTPHCSFIGEHSTERLFALLRRNVADWLRGESGIHSL